MMRSHRIRWVLILALLAGFAAPSVAETLAYANAPCDQAPSHCADVLVSACCCQPAAPSPVAPTSFLTLWSSATKGHWHALAWVSTYVGIPPVDLGSRIQFFLAAQSGPPLSSLWAGEASTVLLI